MFIFYGDPNPSTLKPQIVGISVTSQNIDATPTSAPTDGDAQKLNIIAKPSLKPDGTRWWVYIPDCFTWMVSTDKSVQEGALPLTVPVYYAAARPVIYHRLPTTEGGGLLPGDITIKIAKTGVCFYSDASHYIMAGICYPTTTGDDLLGTLYMTSGYVQPDQYTNAYCPVIFCWDDGGVDQYRLMGQPGTEINWNAMDPQTTPSSRINKTFIELTDSWNTFSGTIETPDAKPLVAYAYVPQSSYRQMLNRTEVQKLITDDYWNTGSQEAAPTGSFVVR